MITFVDTPGLVDGDMRYAFDVEGSITWLGTLLFCSPLLTHPPCLPSSPAVLTVANTADLVLVFFDPMGQALCKRTLDILGHSS